MKKIEKIANTKLFCTFMYIKRVGGTTYETKEKEEYIDNIQLVKDVANSYTYDISKNKF